MLSTTCPCGARPSFWPQGCFKQVLYAQAPQLQLQQQTSAAPPLALAALGTDEAASGVPAVHSTSPESKHDSQNSAAGNSCSQSPGGMSAKLQPQPRELALPDAAQAKDDQPALEDFEEKAFEALKAKHENNKCRGTGRGGRGRGRGQASKAATAGEKGRGRGRGRAVALAQSAQGSRCMKRPAAAMHLSAWEVQKPSVLQRKRTKLSFQSSHYHAARQSALKSGLDANAAKDYARKAYQAAGEVW